MLVPILSAYIRSELRGSFRITNWLAQHLSSLQCAPVCVGNLPPVYMDLRQPTAQQWLKASSWGAGERRVMQRFVRAGQIAFDIGANVGLHTAYLSQLVGPQGKVFAFEPNPSLKQGLARTCEVLGNVDFFPVALANESGQLPFYVPADHTMASLGKWQAATEIKCDVCTLDSLNLPKPSFIKCDVEGAEFDVFQGALSLIDRPDAPVVLFEVNENNVVGFERSATKAIEFLAGLRAGYQFFEVAEEDGDLTSIGSVTCANVLAVPAAVKVPTPPLN